MVSVIVITYGQENYIEEAINGVYMQKTNFPVELIIANDCSPDQTDEKVKKLLSKAPENITVLYTKHEPNIGPLPNFVWALKQAEGKYIAICEGDDYWTDSLKLQKQVGFLESNEEYALVCSNYTSCDNKGNVENADFDITPFDLLHHNPIGTLTAVIKADMLDLPLKTSDVMLGDYLLWTQLAKRGKIRKLGDCTAFYRILSSSASGRDDVNKKIAFLQDAVSVTVDNIHSFELTKSEIKEILFERYSYLINAIPREKKIQKVRYLLEYFGLCKNFNNRDLKYFVSIFRN